MVRRISDDYLKLRTCLSCDREFASNGPGNRICPECAVKGRRVCEKPRTKLSHMKPYKISND